jgi:hypothetical protein
MVRMTLVSNLPPTPMASDPVSQVSHTTPSSESASVSLLGFSGATTEYVGNDLQLVLSSSATGGTGVLVNQVPSQLGLVLPQDPMFGCRGSMFGRSGGFNEVQNENACSWADAFALRGGIKTVLIPEDNVKDLQDIPENVKNGLEIVPVKWIDQVLEVALEAKPVPLSDEEVAAAALTAVPATAKSEAVKH